METALKRRKYTRWIWILSISIPVAIAALFGIHIPGIGPLKFLPPIYASINALTAVVLILAVISIKKGNRTKHERLIKTAIGLSCTFLVLYLIYHITSTSTPYGGTGVLRYIYFVVLISHIFLSVIVIPFVLITFMRGILGDYERHKKIARFTFPLWLYVAISGVIVYLLISPYY